MDADLGRLLGGRYRLESIAGRGGMATIYRARDERTGAEVAVKVLRPEIAADRDLAERFRREALAASVLRHPNIVACLDTGADPAGPYLVMAFIEGEDLTTRLRRETMLPAGRRRPDRARYRAGPGRRPRAGHRPSRRQAREHPPRHRRPRDDHRLRDRPARRRRRGVRAGHDPGLRPVLQPGTGEGRGDDRRLGRVRAGAGAVRGADRPPAMERRDVGGPRPRPGRGTGAVATSHAQRGAGRARCGRRPGARSGSAPSLSERHGPRRRPRTAARGAGAGIAPAAATASAPTERSRIGPRSGRTRMPDRPRPRASLARVAGCRRRPWPPSACVGLLAGGILVASFPDIGAGGTVALASETPEPTERPPADARTRRPNRRPPPRRRPNRS